MGSQAISNISLVVILMASLAIAQLLPATVVGPATCLATCGEEKFCVQQAIMSSTSDHEFKYICTSNVHSYNPCACSPCAQDFNCFVEKPQNSTPFAAVCQASCNLVDCPPDRPRCVEIGNEFGYKVATCVTKSCQDGCQTVKCAAGFECKVTGCNVNCVPTHPKI